MSVKVYSRATGQVHREPQYGEKRLEFLYGTVAGRMLLNAVFARRWYSRLNAIWNSTPLSAGKIPPFVARYGIDLSDYAKPSYRSFADFFERETGKRPLAKGAGTLIAVADSKLHALPITAHGAFKIKQSRYTVAELLGGDEQLAGQYSGGTGLVFRLSADDCHHYCFVDDGRVTGRRTVNGRLQSVQPIAGKRYRAYCENYREYAVIETAHFGQIIAMEVGALLVGKIVNFDVPKFKRGQEKGYFGLGGSSIVLLFKERVIVLDDDILAQSRQGIEAKVKLGERIGTRADA